MSMIELYTAAVRHDVEAVKRVAPPDLLQSITTWSMEGYSTNWLAILIKTAVLNDSLVQYVPEMLDLQLFDAAIIDKKPSLVCMYAALQKNKYSEDTIRKALGRALNMREQQVAHYAKDVNNFVLGLSNKDDRKRR